MVFPVVIYGYESWTIKKAEHQIDAFELWCWRRLLRVPWTARRSNQSILVNQLFFQNIHWKDWCWSWNSNTLATWCKELTHWKRPWSLERLKARGEKDDRGWDGWRHHWLNGHESEQALGVMMNREARHAAVQGVLESQTQLSHWTELCSFLPSGDTRGRSGGCRRKKGQLSSDLLHVVLNFPGGIRGKEPTCQCRRHERCRFNPWFRKIPWRRAWHPTPVFWPAESHGQGSLEGYSP